MMRLFAIVFVLGFVAIVTYALVMRSASRSAAPAADAAGDAGPKGALLAGFAVFIVLAAFGGFALSNTSSAESSTVPSGAGTAFFKPVASDTTGLKVPHSLKAPAGPAYTIKVNAQQFLWRYQYTGLQATVWNTYSYNHLVLPAGVTVLLDFTSSDAEAAWWVPQLGGAITALPGYENKIWVRADKPGVYQGAGSVVNGTNYSNMTTTVNVVPPMLFEGWVKGKQEEIDAAMTGLGDERATGQEDVLITGEKAGAK